MNVVQLDSGWKGPGAEQQDKFVYWGYNFEKSCTEGAEGAPVDANVEFCSVFKLSIGDNKLVLGAEIDCHDGDEGKEKQRCESSCRL